MLKFWSWILVGLALAIVIIAAGLIYSDCTARRHCAQTGGRVVEYNCRTIFVTQHIGKTTIMRPQRTCDWRCEGGR